MTLIEWCLLISLLANCGLGYKLYTTRKTIKNVVELLSDLEKISESTSLNIKKLKTTGGDK